MKQLSLLLSNSPAPSCTFVDVREGGGRGRGEGSVRSGVKGVEEKRAS